MNRVFAIAVLIFAVLVFSMVSLVSASPRDKQFTEVHDNGTVAVSGHKQDGRYHGRIKFFDAKGRLYQEADYREGVAKQEGAFITYYGNGAKQSVERFSKGMLSGKQEEFFEKGTLQRVLHYRRGDRSGAYRLYYQNGRLAEQSQYIDGEMNGRFCKWSKSGDLVEEGTYRRGILDGPYRNYSRGKLLKTLEYRSGKEHGLARELYRNGRDRRRLKYAKGKLQGSAFSFFESGKRMCEAVYKNSQRHGKFHCWHESGVASLEAAYADGVLLRFKLFDASGTLLLDRSSSDEMFANLP